MSESFARRGGGDAARLEALGDCRVRAGVELLYTPPPVLREHTSCPLERPALRSRDPLAPARHAGGVRGRPRVLAGDGRLSRSRLSGTMVREGFRASEKRTGRSPAGEVHQRYGITLFVRLRYSRYSAPNCSTKNRSST